MLLKSNINNELNWQPSDWKSYTALQQPKWADKDLLHTIKQDLKELPPLVFSGEIENLKRNLISAADGNAFCIQGGDCAESFAECKAETVKETFKVILQMAAILSYSGKKQVIKIGRIAGQYAKPRSNDTETINGIEMPSYRGDMVNSIEPNPQSRIADPINLKRGYFRAAASLNLLRAFANGGYGSLENTHLWNMEFVKNSSQGQHFEKIANEIDTAVTFMKTIGLDMQDYSPLKEVNMYTSHEALLLDYEEPLTRRDSITGDWYNCSAHMLWIGDRTRQHDNAHVQFLKGVSNPIGIKVGPKHDLNEICNIIKTLNPNNNKGKIVLITRFGAKNSNKYLPQLIRTIKTNKLNIVWFCDPMHGNTFTSSNSYKTRKFETIFQEIKDFFNIHKDEGTIPGGIHIELTGLNVTECIGGIQGIEEQGLDHNYATRCDPRLNAQQSIELAFRLAEIFRENHRQA